MAKGFEHWLEINMGLFLKTYWALFSVFYFVGIWFALRTCNPCTFAFICLPPYLFISFYRLLHSPLQGLEQGIEKYDPKFYGSVSKEIPAEVLNNPRKRACLFLSSIIRASGADLDPQLSIFKNNYMKIEMAGQHTLMLWLFTGVAVAVWMHVN